MPGTRAVLRQIEAGNTRVCEGCGKAVIFRAKQSLQQVICNVYVDGKWNRVEHWHPGCYFDAGSPHGVIDADDAKAKRRA